MHVRHQSDDEHELLARAQQLDTDALGVIHDRYYVPVYRYIVLRVGDHHTAEDLAGDVFVRLLDALRSRTPPRVGIRAWLFGVAAHVVSDHHRRHYRRPQAPLDEHLVSNDAGPDEHVLADSTRTTLEHALERLTADQRHVLALRFGRELSIDDAARQIGKSAGAVKQLQARALAALGRWMVHDE